MNFNILIKVALFQFQLKGYEVRRIFGKIIFNLIINHTIHYLRK